MATPEITDAQLTAVWINPKLTRKQGAAHLGLTVNAMTKRARRLGLPMREPVHERQATVTDAQVRKIWARDDLSRAEQARAVGITAGALRERANKLKLPMRRLVKDRRIPVSRIREVWMNPHLTGQQAADIVGLTRVNLQLRAKALGLPPRKQGTRFSIIGKKQEAIFTAMWEAPVRASEIADHFDIHIMTVSAQARRMNLSKRTHPSRLISMDKFWKKQEEERLRSDLSSIAETDMIAQRRFANEDFYADPTARSPKQEQQRAIKKAVRSALKQKGTTIAVLARDLDLAHQTVSSVVYGEHNSPKVEKVVSEIIGQPIRELRDEAKMAAFAAE